MANSRTHQVKLKILYANTGLIRFRYRKIKYKTNIKRLRIIVVAATTTTTTTTTTTITTTTTAAATTKTTTDDKRDSGLSVPCDMAGKKPSVPKLVFQNVTSKQCNKFSEG